MSSMRRIGYLVSENYAEVLRVCTGFLNEHEYLSPFFKQAGAELVAVDWRKKDVDWNSFDALLPKAVWDYFDYPTEFEAFLKKIAAGGPPMVNGAEVVSWNMRKTYLAELQRRGLPVGELTLFPQGSRVDARELASVYADASSVVIKPSISGGGRNTVKCAPSELGSHAGVIGTILSYSDLILQPFFPEIAESGEFSYFFFGGKFSHAIQKKPKAGDYRAHQLFGGTNRQIHPDSQEIAQAWAFVEGSKFDCPYARVDAFKRDGVLHLVELELIEPHLYFENADADAGARFASAVMNQIQA